MTARAHNRTALVSNGAPDAATGESYRGIRRICFVAPRAYNVLAQRSDLTHVGGAEVQVVSLARALAAIGYQVQFVTLDYGQPDEQDVDGITVYKSYAQSAGLPLIRFAHPRWTGVCRALHRANADMYIQAGADGLTGQVALWCRRHRRRFTFLAMSDEDCVARSSFLPAWRDRKLFDIGVRRADCVVVQSHRQQRLLRQSRGVDSVVIRPCVLHGDADCRRCRYVDSGPRALWLGRFSPEKRIEWLLDIAGACPDVEFDIVGGANSDDDYATGFIDRARALPNVHLAGHVAYAQVGGYYAGAQVLLLTSRQEGFPTVFMEAWRYGLPTVSTIDVDDLIADKGLGAVADTVEEMVAALRDILSSRRRWCQCSDQARAHFLAAHTPAAAARAMKDIVIEA